MKYVKIYGKSIKTNLKAKLDGDTIAKKQKSPERRRRTHTNIRPMCCAASRNIML